MQEGKTGKPIFRHRYIGMKEEAIREEVDRLQMEVYALEKALDSFEKNGKENWNLIIEGQKKNEELISSIDERFSRLQSNLDYEAPLKKQLVSITKDMGEKLKDANRQGWSRLEQFLLIDTILLFVVIVLIVVSILV
ncbi:hypothetical protein CIY_14340 [Butyrivibrio fibrisolvens 16/4]|nr:hypothetical protein CIY_14340 [Butyrivibrio fibrisolvens 16/4]